MLPAAAFQSPRASRALMPEGRRYPAGKPVNAARADGASSPPCRNPWPSPGDDIEPGGSVHRYREPRRVPCESSSTGSCGAQNIDRCIAAAARRLRSHRGSPHLPPDWRPRHMRGKTGCIEARSRATRNRCKDRLSRNHNCHSRRQCRRSSPAMVSQRACHSERDGGAGGIAAQTICASRGALPAHSRSPPTRPRSEPAPHTPAPGDSRPRSPASPVSAH